jgi:saccharopine dehydrogenase-like NADP-dependent oxidoreductase
MPFDYPCKNLEYKTIRYKGHYDVIKMLYNLGFFDEARGLRRTTIEMLEKIIPKTNEDMVLMKVIGISGNRTKEFNGIVLYDEKWTAMQKMTGYGCVISALGIIKEIDILKYENYGVFMPYEIFEGKKFLSYLTKFLKHFEFNYD